MNATFSKGQRVVGEYRGCGYAGVITVATYGGRDALVSVVLDNGIQVSGENFMRTFFMTHVDDAGDFTDSIEGFMAIETRPDTPPEDFGVFLQPAPAEVDMGGDFDGFIAEAVNAGQTEPFTPDTWYTDPATSADGEKIQARGTKQLDGSYIVEVLADGMAIAGEFDRFEPWADMRCFANDMAVRYLRKLNHDRAIEMGDETETIYPPLIDKATRIAQLTAHIERLDRERDSLAFELAQLVGE